MALPRSLKTGLLIPLFVCLLVSSSHGDAAKKYITIAVLPCYDSVATLKKFGRLSEYLKERSGHEIKLVVPTDFEKVKTSLQNGDIDFILQDPHTYVQLEDLLNRDAILSSLAWDGSRSQVGMVIARKDSGIRRIEDLRGKSVLFGPKLSIAKWIGAREMFRKSGLDIDKDLATYSHGGCCEDIAFNVYVKAVDAGVVCDDFFDEYPGGKTELGMDLKEIVVIGKTDPYPTRIFAARIGTDVGLLSRVNQALLNLDKKNPEDEKILSPAQLGGFRAARDRDYDDIRAYIQKNPM